MQEEKRQKDNAVALVGGIKAMGTPQSAFDEEYQRQKQEETARVFREREAQRIAVEAEERRVAEEAEAAAAALTARYKLTPDSVKRRKEKEKEKEIETRADACPSPAMSDISEASVVSQA